MDDGTSSEQSRSLNYIISPQKTASKISAEHYNITNEQFSNLKKENLQFISLIDSFKSAFVKGENIREKKKSDLKMMMDNLPSSAYQCLYEEELNKLHVNN